MQQFIHKYIYSYIVYTIKTMAHVCMTLFLFLFFFFNFWNVIGLQIYVNI